MTSIAAMTALIEYLQDPDPPEMRQLEVEERIEQLELENDSLYIAMEDAEWEVQRSTKRYRCLRNEHYKLKNEYDVQRDLLLQLGTQYSDLKVELATLEDEVNDRTIVYRSQISHQESLVQELYKEVDDYKGQFKSMQREKEKLLRKIDEYEISLASKDLRLFKIVEERDSLHQSLQKLTALQEASLQETNSVGTSSTKSTTSSASEADATNQPDVPPQHHVIIKHANRLNDQAMAVGRGWAGRLTRTMRSSKPKKQKASKVSPEGPEKEEIEAEFTQSMRMTV